ncbi:hypothetical protein PYW08_000728 [Mythimna loreyi]|uniref:Uncharacterized protein n=1 Tax=Mythimna loreyi TaxID=667449 RepID=A0ACC2R0G4_9NEOP|nr:hypothetical protein PYW08_000728 [Mythimna loreyi]
MTVFIAILSIATYAGLVKTVLPPQCLANFRWDDCGGPARTVMYYWRVASRCEVGIWRGCLPNINMFKNEYDCVTTCTFAVRAGAANFHELNEIEAEFTTPSYEDGFTDADSDNTSSTTEGDSDNSTTPAANITTDEPGEGGDDKDNDGEEKDEGGKDEGGDDKKDEGGEGGEPNPDGEGKEPDPDPGNEGEPDNENEEEPTE